MEISVSKLRNRDLHEIMRLVYCMDRERFVSAFQQIGINILSEDDLAALAEFNKLRLDVDGKLPDVKNSKGEPLKFDIREFVNYNIPVRHSLMKNCKITYVK